MRAPDALRLTFFTTCVLLGAGGCATPPTWGEKYAFRNTKFPLPESAEQFMIYHEYGAAESETTIVFLHGAGSSKEIFSETADSLQQRYRVVLVDLLGHGDASAPEDGDYRMAAQGRRVAALLSDLHKQRRGSSFVLVGVCYGSGVALEAAKQLAETERGDLVRGLVLLAPLAFDFQPPKEFAALYSPAATLLIPLLSSHDLAYGALRVCLHDETRLRDKSVAEQTRIYERRAPRVAARLATLAPPEEVWQRQRDELAAGRSPFDYFNRIRCPVLVLRGQRDRVLQDSSTAENLVLALKRERSRVSSPESYEPRGLVSYSSIPEVGHAVNMEQPELFLTNLREFMKVCPKPNYFSSVRESVDLEPPSHESAATTRPAIQHP